MKALTGHLNMLARMLFTISKLRRAAFPVMNLFSG
jgi:hypothetical protein